MVALFQAQARRAWRLAGVITLLALALAAMAAPGYRFDTLDFVNAEIPMVIKALADGSGANVVVGPEVKGQITVKLRNVSVEEALNIITGMSNLTYALKGTTYVVNVRQAGGSTEAPPDFVLVATLKSLSTTDAIGALGVGFRDVQMKDLPPNRLVLGGSMKRVQAAKAFLDSIDTEPTTRLADPIAPLPGGGTITPAVLTVEQTYRVKALVPWQAKAYLEGLYKGDGLGITYAPSRVTPTDNPAAKPEAGWQSDTLVLRGPEGVVKAALVSMSKIDLEQPLVEQRCSVKRIYASQAITYLLDRFEPRGLAIYTVPMTSADVSQKSDGVKDAGSKSGAIGAMVRRGVDGKLNVAEPIGDFIVRGAKDVVEQAVAALTTVDIGPERIRKIYTLRFLKGSEVKSKLETQFAPEGLSITLAPTKRGRGAVAGGGGGGAAAEGGGGGGGGGGGASAGSAVEVVDVILSGPQPVVDSAVSMISALDSEPPQIQIKTDIMSVDSSVSTTMGVQWSGIVGTSSSVGSASIGITESQSSDPLKLGRFIRGPLDLNATINALVSSNKAKVVNRPQTVVQSGETATVHVGGIFYYETVTAVTNTGPVYSLSSVNTGVTLTVRPVVSRDGLITLEILTNVTDRPTFRKGVSGADVPTINESNSSTVVQVRSGETLVIGGLMQSSEQEVRQEVPGLGRIPIIGALFRNKQVVPSQSELLFMVTPTLLQAGGTAATAPAATGTTPAPAGR